MRRFKDKDNINTLLNIDSVFGEYPGKVMPIVFTLLLAGVPPILWLIIDATPFRGFVPLWVWILFWVLWTARWALIILGKESQKMRFYDGQRTDEYKSANELVHISHLHDDGLIEYDNGRVAYILSGYVRSYLDDDTLSVELEAFMDDLDMWSWDMYMHNTVDEILCIDNLPNLKRYNDLDVIQERIGYYTYQDEWVRENTGLYRVTFLVSTIKSNWKKMKMHLEELATSEQAKIFNEFEIFDALGVNDILNRDICGFSNLTNMLINKYENNNFYQSKVMWYGDNIPEEFIKDKEVSELDSRRS